LIVGVDQQKELNLLLEAALLEYVEKYGMTERARQLLTSPSFLEVPQNARTSKHSAEN
jgi:hypothetical protein